MLSWLFLYGAVLGSFLTVCVHRLPKHASIRDGWAALTHKPSHCDQCDQRLLARDNIPILGWLILWGRCRFCKVGIPAKYPLIELANGLLFVLVYALEVPLNHWTPLSTTSLACHLGPSTFDNAWGLSPVTMVNCRYLYHLILVEALLVVALVDWESMVIPDSITVPAILTGVLGGTLFGTFWIVPVWFQDPAIAQITADYLPAAWHGTWLTSSVPEWIQRFPHLHGLAASLAGMVIGGGVVWIVRRLGRFALQREVMGSGDVFQMAMIGSFIGWQPVIIAFFFAPILALLASIVTRTYATGREIAYGPYLGLGTLLVLLGWHWIWPFAEWYFSLGPVLILIATGMVVAVVPLLALWQQIMARISPVVVDRASAARLCIANK